MNQNHKGIGCLIVIMAFVFGLFFTSYAAEPKPLLKSQAMQLLSLMGYKDVEVGAIVLGVNLDLEGDINSSSGQNLATVLAIGRRDGKLRRLIQTFYYDAEIGWFDYEYDSTNDDPNSVFYKPLTKLRMWTLSGYKEFRPKQAEGAGK